MSIKYRKVSIEEAIKPKSGICLVDRWWTVTPEREILFYREHAPQCNADENIAKEIRDRIYPEGTVEFLEVVFTGRHE